MSRGKILRLKRGQLAFIAGTAVYARDGKIELYVYGDGEIIMPNDVRSVGQFDTKEAIDKMWRDVNGNQMDKDDL